LAQRTEDNRTDSLVDSEDIAPESELERVRAQATREIEEARSETRSAAKRLLELESRRANELELLRHAEAKLEAAQQTIREMQQTRLWRIGGTYWGLRDLVFRRGRN
jgi:hypothetical protein